MRKLILLLSILTFSSLANDITKVWKELDNYYFSLIQAKEYKKALIPAFELNNIDPSDTQFLLYIVFSSVKSKTELPKWVMKEPWANATKQDVFNRLLAEQLVNGSQQSP